MLHAEGVWVAYDADPVLRDVSLRVVRGDLVGILGPNGSGKTTLLRVLGGLATPQRGSVSLDGCDLSRFPRAELARRLAIVPQETHLAFDYTVLEIALMGRYPYLGAFELEGPTDLAVARAALAATGTLLLQDRSFSTLSGGEKQRVIVASALAQIWESGTRDRGLGTGGEPAARGVAASPARPRASKGEIAPAPSPQPPGPGSEILLLDEPTASLDLRYQLEMAATLRALNRERQITMVVSTHDLNLAAGLCRDLVLLREGRVMAAGATEAVLTADAVRELYDADADVRWHEQAGHVTVVPLHSVHGPRIS